MQITMTQLNLLFPQNIRIVGEKITLHCNSLHINCFVLTPQGNFTGFLSGLGCLDHYIQYTFCHPHHDHLSISKTIELIVQ